MNSYNKPNRFSIDYYKQPEIVYTPEEKQKEEPKEEPKKVLEKMHNPEPEDRLEKDAKKMEKKEPEEKEYHENCDKNMKEHKDINDFEKLKNKFLNVKNKSLFIKKNKDKIKSLIADEQKQFIQMAKSYFDSV